MYITTFFAFRRRESAIYCWVYVTDPNVYVAHPWPQPTLFCFSLTVFNKRYRYVTFLCNVYIYER